jgi:hypothetical protein
VGVVSFNLTHKKEKGDHVKMSPLAECLLVEQIAPRLRATSRCLPQVGADDADELYADGIAMAAQMLDSAEKRGKKVTAGNIAWYATKQLSTGRRSTYAGRADALCPAAQLDGNAQFTSLQQEVAHDPITGEGIPLGEFLADEADDPAEAAARNLDWTDFLSGADDLSTHMIVAFARGDTMRGLKEEAGLSDSGMSGRKRALAAGVLEHFGPDCLADADRDPGWKADVVVQREKDACRRETCGV